MVDAKDKRIAELERQLADAKEDTTITGVNVIATERKRQIESEGWSAKHDDLHDNSEMAWAAACYAAPEPIKAEMQKPCGCRSVGECSHQFNTHWSDPWPWSKEWDKRGKSGRLRDLAKAGALIAAEIDRLLRSEAIRAARKERE
jgi:hypothetical protein